MKKKIKQNKYTYIDKILKTKRNRTLKKIN